MVAERTGCRSGRGLLPYWFLFAVFAVGAILSPPGRSGEASFRPLLAFGALLVAAMVGLRWEVGGDWQNYDAIFRTISFRDPADVVGLVDPGYAMLNWAAAQIGLGLVFVDSVVAAVFAYGLYRFAREQPQPWLTILIAVPYLIIVVAMGYTRQAAAIGLIFCALTERNRRSPVRLFLLVLLAATFHRSAIVIVPILLMAAARSRIAMVAGSLLTIIVLYYLLVAASVDGLFLNYIVAQYDSSGAAVRVALNIPPAVIFLVRQRRFGLDEQERRLWFNFSIAAILALVLLVVTPSTTAVDRLALYLIPLQMFVFNRLATDRSEGQGVRREILAGLIAYSALIQFVWLNFATNSWAWLPYSMAPFVDRW